MIEVETLPRPDGNLAAGTPFRVSKTVSQPLGVVGISRATTPIAGTLSGCLSKGPLFKTLGRGRR